MPDMDGQPKVSISDDTDKGITDDVERRNPTVVSPGASENPEYGAEASVHSLYRQSDEKPWTSTMPTELQNLSPESPTGKFALIVRKEILKGEEPVLGLHSIVVQSSYLKNILQDVFEGYRGLATELKQLVFEWPFYIFVHRWNAYLKRAESETNELAKSHIELFNAVIKPEIMPLVEKRNELLERQVISYRHLWMIFEPEITIHTTVNGYDRCFHLLSLGYGKKGLGLYCRFMECDGAVFCYEHTVLRIRHFAGYKPFKELGVIPIKYHPRKEEVEMRLLARGRRFEQFKGFHYVTYAGMVLYPTGESDWVKEKLDGGRVIIDAGLFERKNYKNVSAPDPLRTNDPPRDPEGKDSDSEEIDPENNTSEVRRPAKTTLDESEYIFCTPELKGYCLVTKRWALFSVDQVSTIEWNDNAFKRLILPDDHKEVILAVVGSHEARETGIDDIIEGKGRGIIVLLHGEPGVGKTFTAEAVSEEMRRPLYYMSAGELGWDAGSVERMLRNIFEICAKWKAVLLLDECDVLLEQRSVWDLARNKLVSVFLRMLEHYDGVLFLTTNRVNNFDRAFKSRIDLSITYPSLDFASKRRIWTNFATASPDSPSTVSELGPTDLDTFAHLDLNGREIKSIVKTGRLLAKSKGAVLNAEHVRTALRVHRVKGDEANWAEYGVYV